MMGEPSLFSNGQDNGEFYTTEKVYHYYGKWWRRVLGFMFTEGVLSENGSLEIEVFGCSSALNCLGLRPKSNSGNPMNFTVCL